MENISATYNLVLETKCFINYLPIKKYNDNRA